MNEQACPICSSSSVAVLHGTAPCPVDGGVIRHLRVIPPPRRRFRFWRSR